MEATTQTKFIPILFSTPMVEAIMGGRKTQTRRVCKLNPTVDEKSGYTFIDYPPIQFDIHTWKEDIMEWCPYGVRTDILWVRETFYAWGMWKEQWNDKSNKMGYTFVDFIADLDEYDHEYRFTSNPPEDVLTNRKVKKIGYYKRPSIFLPREACRLFLEITNVRIERLHDIGEFAAIAEGIHQIHPGAALTKKFNNYTIDLEAYSINTVTAKECFYELWKEINGFESWDVNPFVWVVEFKRIEKPKEFSV